VRYFCFSFIVYISVVKINNEVVDKPELVLMSTNRSNSKFLSREKDGIVHVQPCDYL